VHFRHGIAHRFAPDQGADALPVANLNIEADLDALRIGSKSFASDPIDVACCGDYRHLARTAPGRASRRSAIAKTTGP